MYTVVLCMQCLQCMSITDVQSLIHNCIYTHVHSCITYNLYPAAATTDGATAGIIAGSLFAVAVFFTCIVCCCCLSIKAYVSLRAASE